MQLRLAEISGSIEERGEFPLLSWKAVWDWIDQRGSTPTEGDELSSALDRLVVEWVGMVCERFAPKYRLLESEQFVIMTCDDDRRANLMLEFCGNAARLIHRRLGKLAPDGTGGKHVVFFSDGDEDYFRYASSFIDSEAEGEERLAPAMLISQGYPHTVVMHVTLHGSEASLVHELVHDFLWVRALPLWLEEGVAVTIERDFHGRARPEISRELFDQLQAYWNDESIQHFWWGISFSDASGSDLSYKLAEALVDIILRNHSEGFAEFALNANWEDAGETAARAHLGRSMGEIAAVFLGEGDWTPKPGSWLEQASD